MINDIVQTIDEIIELLENCNLKTWADKYANWKHEINTNKNDAEKIQKIIGELYVASAPRGWLGDYPITSSIVGKFDYEAIETRRRFLVDKITTQLKDAGVNN